MTDKAEQDPWRLAWMVTCRKLRMIPRPGWGVCVSLLEDAACNAFRSALVAMRGTSERGTWKQAHDAALEAAHANIAEQKGKRDPEDVKRWRQWGTN